MSIGNSGRDLLIAIALIVPLDWMMSSSRIVGKPPDPKRGAIVAGSVLAVCFAIKIGLEMAYKERSYYDMLDVLPGASSSDLKKGYKRASLQVHPDKLRAAGEDEDAGDEAFVALKAAYDVLSDSYTRDLYDKFGPQGLESKNDTTSLLAGIGFFYVVWLALAYLVTRRKTVNRAQIWCFSGLLALGIFEYQACVLSYDFLQEQIPQLVMFEKVELLHRLYPVYLLASRLVAFVLFQDLDKHNFVMLQHLHWKTDRLRERLMLLTNHSVAPGTVPYASPAEWAQLAKQNQLLIKQQIQAQGAQGFDQASQTLPLAAGAVPPSDSGLPNAAVAARPAAAAPAKGGGGGGRNLSGLIWFFGVYFFFQWLVGRGS